MLHGQLAFIQGMQNFEYELKCQGKLCTVKVYTSITFDRFQLINCGSFLPLFQWRSFTYISGSLPDHSLLTNAKYNSVQYTVVLRIYKKTLLLNERVKNYCI